MPVRYRRPILIVLYALGVLAVGVWADIAMSGRTDLLRDLLSTGITLVFGAVAGDVALTAVERLYASQPHRAALLLLVTLAVSITAVLIGHLLTPLMAMLVQIPRTGFEILPTIVLSLEFLIRQALLPSVLIGSVIGLAVAAILPGLVRDHQA